MPGIDVGDRMVGDFEYDHPKRHGVIRLGSTISGCIGMARSIVRVTSDDPILRGRWFPILKTSSLRRRPPHMSESNRIESLEAQVRTLRRMLFGVFGLVVLGALLAATTLQTVPDVIRAKKFEVVNEDEQPIVLLAANQSGGLVEIRNGNGKGLVRLTSHPEGGTISIHDSRARTLIHMGGNERGSGALQTRTNKGGTLVSVGTNLAGEGVVFTENGNGEKTSSMP